MADQDFQDLTNMRQAIHAGYNPEDVVWRGEDGTRATDVDKGQFALYGDEQVAAFDKVVTARNNNEVSPDLINQQATPQEDEENTGLLDMIKNNQVNAWKKFYATEEDTLIEAKKISDSTGIPENIILTNDDSMEQAKEIYKAQQKNVDMEQVFKDNPALATLAQNGNDTLAAIAMNHLPEIKEQKSLVDSIKDNLRIAEIQFELRAMGDEERAGGAEIDTEKVKSLQEEMKKLEGPGFSEDPIGAVVGGTAQQLPQMLRGGLKAIERGTQMATAGAMAGFAVGSAAGGVGAVPGAITGALAGFGLGSRYGYFEGSYNEMAGSNYLQLRMETDKYGNHIWSKDQANTLAIAQAAASAGIESWEAGRILGRLAGAKGQFASELKDIVKGAVNKESGFAAMGAWLKDNMIAAAKTTLEESAEEAAQSLSDDTIRNIFTAYYGKDGAGVNAKQMYENAAENFTQALAPSAGFGLMQFGASLGGATTRRIARGLEIKTNFDMQVEKTNQGIQLMSQIKGMLDKSDYYKKSPEAATATLQHNLEGSGFENVYVDTATMRENGENELLSQVVDTLNVSEEEKQAILNGTQDISSPVSFSQIAVSKIDEKVNNYISFDANAMSFAKNKRFAEIIKQDLADVTKFDKKSYDDIVDIIVNDFQEQDREQARNLISKYGLDEAAKTVSSDLKSVNTKIDELLNRNSPNANEGYSEGELFSYYIPGRGYGYFTDTDNRIVQEDEIGPDVKGEMNTRWEWHAVKRGKVQPQWVKTWHDTNNRRMTKADERQIIIDSVLGNNNGNIWDQAPKTLEQDRALLPTLLSEQERLQRLKESFKGISRNADNVARGLSKEGYKVYKMALASLKSSTNKDVSRSAEINAILLARHADRFAEVVRSLGRNYTALDYIRRVRIDANGEVGKAIHDKGIASSGNSGKANIGIEPVNTPNEVSISSNENSGEPKSTINEHPTQENIDIKVSEQEQNTEDTQETLHVVSESETSALQEKIDSNVPLKVKDVPGLEETLAEYPGYENLKIEFVEGNIDDIEHLPYGLKVKNDTILISLHRHGELKGVEAAEQQKREFTSLLSRTLKQVYGMRATQRMPIVNATTSMLRPYTWGLNFQRTQLPSVGEVDEQHAREATDLANLLPEGILQQQAFDRYFEGMAGPRTNDNCIKYFTHSLYKQSTENGLTITPQSLIGNVRNAIRNDYAAKNKETFSQEDASGNLLNGEIIFADNTSAIISLYETADEVTFAHEAGHLFLKDLEELATIQGVPQQIIDDYNTVLEWASWDSSQLKEYSGLSTYEEFAKRDEEIRYAQKHGGYVMRRGADGKYNRKVTLDQLKEEWKQERFARGWEEYLHSGKAPTSSLQRVFRMFKEWITSIYKDYIAVGPAPSMEVKAVMDRMLATEEEIDIEAKRSSYNSFVRAGGLNFLAESNQAMFEKYWQEAKEEAKERVLKDAINDSKAAFDKDERAKEEARIRPQIEDEARANTVLAIDEMMNQGDELGLEGLCEMANMTVADYKQELSKLGGSFEGYVDNQVQKHMEEYVTPPIIYENIKQNAQTAITEGKYADKLAEYEIEAMVQKGRIEQRIGKMADKKFAEIEKALSGIDASAKTEEKINALQQRINDLKYTIRWNEAEQKMIFKLEKAANDAKLEAQKIEDKAKLEAEKQAHKQDVKEAKYNQQWREAELNLIIDGLKTTVKAQLSTFNEYRKQQRQGLRVVRDAEKGWISETRKFINGEFANTMSINEYGNEAYNTRKAKEHRMESANLMADGEWEAAALEKREEVNSTLKANLARLTQKFMDKIKVNVTKKLKTLKKQDHVAANQRYMFHTIAMAFDLTPEVELRTPAEFVSMEATLQEMGEAGYVMEFESTALNTPPSWLVAAFNGEKQDLKDLTGAELRDFNNFMNMLYKSGSKQMVQDKDGRKLEINEACVAIRAQANERMQKIQEAGEGKAHQEETKRQWFARLARKANANILQTETILDMMGPLAHNLIYDRINDAAMNELRALGATTKKLQTLMDKTLGANSQEFLKKKYRFGDEVISGQELLAIALNCGTESNKARVFSSFNVNEEQLYEALSNLTDNEWKFVQGVWDMFEENWPKVADVQIAITGGMARKEPAKAFTIKGANSATYEIKGGYYPIRYDNKQGTRTRQLEASNNIRAASMTAAGKNTGTGFTKERAKNVSDQVLSTDLGLVSSMLAEQVHFIEMRQAYLDARAVINNKEFKNSVIEQFGGDMQAVMEEWVESQWANTKGKEGIVDTAARTARTALTLGALSYRVTTALINVANIATVSAYLGPVNALKAVQSFYGRGMFREQYRNEIFSKSVFLAQRAEVFDANIRENVRKQVGVSRWNKMTEAAKDAMMAGFKPIMLTDMMFAMPAWQFEYERVLREADPTKRTPEQIEADAVRAGDRAVRKCFGSGMKQDINSLQRGSELTKTFTTFYSYFAVVHNMVASKIAEGRRANFQGKGTWKTIAPIANAVLCEYIAQSLIDAAVREGMNSIGDDDWKWERFWKKSASNVADNMFGAFPVLRDLVPRGLEQAMGEHVNDFRVPIIDAGYKLLNIFKDVANDKKDKVDVAYDCTKFISVLTGLPDPLLNAVPTTVRFVDEYAKQNGWEYIKKVMLDQRLKSK